MAKKPSQTSASKPSAPADTRAITRHFNSYNQVFNNDAQRWILAFSLIFFYLGLLGIFWIIPFPHMKWMGSYNGYFNWASFLIAFLLYYWLKQSPLLSYFLLFLLLALSYGVTLIQAWYQAGGISVWIIYPALLIATTTGLLKMISKRHLNFIIALLFLPLWLLHLVAKRFSVRY